MKLNWGLHLDGLDRPEVTAYVCSRCHVLSSQFQCIAETGASDQSSHQSAMDYGYPSGCNAFRTTFEQTRIRG